MNEKLKTMDSSMSLIAGQTAFSRRCQTWPSLPQAGPGLAAGPAPCMGAAAQEEPGRKDVFFVDPINLKSVTYVTERLLPFSPV